MVKEYINGNEWIRKTLEKMKAFLDRTPILVTEIIGTKDCKDGVFIIPEGAVDDSHEQVKLFFPFDYDIEPKAWVHNIREASIPYYPHIVEPIYENVELTPKEMAIKAEEGVDISSIPKFEKRLVKRNTSSKDAILERFKTDYKLINEYNKYNYVVVNDELDKAAKKVNSIIEAQKCMVERIEEVYLSNPEEEIHELLIDDKEFENKELNF